MDLYGEHMSLQVIKWHIQKVPFVVVSFKNKNTASLVIKALLINWMESIGRLFSLLVNFC